ncbi:MAG: FGGY-family carbohydrate kinase [Phycisphaeraceae bacterium]|nr:FGGY-family carbohydrate kinase [Phycisphaeraceae bacterium]
MSQLNLTHYTLIFDLGTTYFKAAIMTGEHDFVAIAEVPTPIKSPQVGWSEIKAPDFLTCINQLMADLHKRSPDAYSQIQCISFATQANSFLLLDQSFNPVSPIIVWNDQRAESIDLTGLNNYHLTGIPAASYHLAPVKLRWLQQHQPDIFKEARQFCFLSDYLTYHFTSQHVTEAGVAGLSAMVDIHQLCWIPQVIEKLNLQQLNWPTIHLAGKSLGPISTQAATTYGLNPDCRFTLGCLDQYAGPLAANLMDNDGICETTGTVLASVRTSPKFDLSLQKHGVYQGPSPRSGCYFHMLFTEISANLLAIYRKQFTPDLSYEDLDALASGLSVMDQNLKLVGFDMHRSSFNFEGDSKYQDIAHQVQAIYYRVALELKKQVNVHYQTSPPVKVMSLGGGANSQHWLNIKAAVLGCLVIAIPSEKPTCLGAYRLTHTNPTSKHT